MVNNDNILVIGSDHGGFELKEYLKERLTEDRYKIKDFGTFSAESVDYPDIIHPLAKSINEGQYERGIILCGSGNGAQITANKYLHVRAALCWNEEQARLAREHNDANIISLPGRVLDFELAYRMVIIFLNTAFEGGRHARRVAKISDIIK
ncbi:MAG: ribose 5-phosphate isomerase B [bacterium]